MGLLSQKLRSGVLELVTETGSFYSSPTLLERAYLLWTFRNFPRLSRVVLNERQRELIDKLCRNTANLRHRVPADALIIGVVEHVTIAAQRRSVAAAASVVAINSAEAHVAQAVGASLKSALARVQSRQPVMGVTVFSPTPSTISGQALAKTGLGWGTREGRRKWLKPTVALSAGAVLLAGVLYARHNRATVHLQLDQSYAPILPTAVTAAPEQAPSRLAAEAIEKPSAARVVSQSLVAAVPLRATAAARPANATSTNQVTAPAIVPSVPAAPRARVEPTAQPIAIAAAPAIASPPTDGQPATGVAREISVPPPAVARMVISAAPVSFGYPVAPKATLLGKVHLRIVIGADGSVKDVSALGGNAALADAAVKAVRRWKYRPPVMNGQAVEAETNVTINFAGDDAVTIAYR